MKKILLIVSRGISIVISPLWFTCFFVLFNGAESDPKLFLLILGSVLLAFSVWVWKTPLDDKEAEKRKQRKAQRQIDREQRIIEKSEKLKALEERRKEEEKQRAEEAHQKAILKAEQVALAQKEKERCGIYVPFEQLDELEDNGVLPNLDENDLTILLKADEQAVYACDAVLRETKNKAVGRTGGSRGASFRVAKGVSIRTGGSQSRTVYADVTTDYEGVLFITTDRVVFSGVNKSVEIKIPSISSIVDATEVVQIQSGTKSYMFAVPIPKHIKTVISKLYK